MHFDERNEGDFRIFAGAIEAPLGHGFVASVVVNRVIPEHDRREVFRDVSMSGGHRWATSAEALRYAVRKARQVIRTQPQRLGGGAS